MTACTDTIQLQTHDLGGGHSFLSGRLPSELVWDAATFETVWASHPAEYQTIMIHGRPVKLPRWQQAYGMDYQFSGQVSRALPVPTVLEPILDWVKASIDPRLNGQLVIWYDGKRRHYIGAHRDSTDNMCAGSPIVTVSFGESRVFRLRPWKGKGFRDFPALHATVFVLPYATNLSWTHEVPHPARSTGRRISVTARAFESSIPSAPDC